MLQNANGELERFVLRTMRHRLARREASASGGELAPSLPLPPRNFEVCSRFRLCEETGITCRLCQAPGICASVGGQRELGFGAG